MKKYFLFYILLSTISALAQKKQENISRHFYTDNVLAIERFYSNDKKIDSLKTFYKSGELNEVFYFKNSSYNGLCFQYNKSGKKITTWLFNEGKLIERTNHIIKFNIKNEEKIKTFYNRLEKINKAIKQKPNSFKLRFQRASIRKHLGNYTLALNDFKKIEKKVLKKSETKKVPEKLMGSVFDHLAYLYDYYEMKNHTIHYRVKALIASPKESRLYHNLGSYLVMNQNYRLGIQYLNKAIEMVPNHSFANRSLAIAYTELEDYKKAMGCITIAFKNEKNLYKRGSGKVSRDLRTTRGFLHHKLGDSEKGILDLEEALVLNNSNSFALKNLGIIYHDLENYNKSCKLLQSARNLGYEKIHDKYDLEDYLEYSCNNKTYNLNKISVPEKPFVYPNPVKDKINIHNFNAINFNYSIYNFESKLVHKGKSNNKSISLPNMPQGLYILVVEVNDVAHSFKIVKD